MKQNIRVLILTLATVIRAFAADPVAASSDASTNAAISGTPTSSVVYVTNQVPTTVVTMPSSVASETTSSTLTNVTGDSGSSLLGAFSAQTEGKFSISGRTLKLPAPGALNKGPEEWDRSLEFGMNQSRGNTESLRYSLGLDTVKESTNDLFRVKAKASYGESSGTKDTENAYACARYERLISKYVYGLGNLDWAVDTIADLRYRITGILSPGVRLIRSETALLYAETGAGYIAERKGSSEHGYMAGRVALTFEHVINTHVMLWCSGEYFPKLGDPSIFYLNAETGVASYLTRDLSLNVSFQERYDSAPVEGKESADTVLATSISLHF